MKIIIPGGSGQVGTILARHFCAAGHDVVVLSRRPTQAPWRVVQWDAANLGAWGAELEAADVVINMAGRSVNCRYHAANRREILESRIRSTSVIGDAIRKAKQPPRVWLQAATATIYAHRFDSANDEANGIIGGNEPNSPDTWRFSIDVAQTWERACNEAETPKTRKVILRSAMTMSPDPAGVFDVLLRLVRFRLGGKSGNGRQFVSWIHDLDFIRAIDFLIASEEIDGAVNVASPCPVPNAEFMTALRSAWGTSWGLPAANWMLELGAMALRTETELILKSRRVVPGRLLDAGFDFHFPEWSDGATDLVHRWRLNNSRQRKHAVAEVDVQMAATHEVDA